MDIFDGFPIFFIIAHEIHTLCGVLLLYTKALLNNVFRKKAVPALEVEAEAELDTAHLRGKLLKSLAEALRPEPCHFHPDL